MYSLLEHTLYIYLRMTFSKKVIYCAHVHRKSKHTEDEDHEVQEGLSIRKALYLTVI